LSELEKGLKFIVTYSKTISLGNGNFEKYSLTSEFLRGEAPPSEAFRIIKNQVLTSIEAPSEPAKPSKAGSMDPAALDQVPWREGKYGEYCFEDQAPPELVKTLKNGGSQIFGDYRYKVSQGQDRIFVNRSRIKPKKA